MDIFLSNTLTKKKELFKPIKKNSVGIYSCGPTVYDYPHLGNTRAYICSDILRRIFEFNGYNVNQVMNFTDVGHLTSDEDSGEDKLEVASSREKKSVWDIAEFYINVFKKYCKELNIESPEHWVRATDNIFEMIELIKALEKKGFTYIIEDGVYFDTSKFSNYGKLGNIDLKGLQAGSRVEMAKGKKNITDFALWKFSSHKDSDQAKRQMEWESPWGMGFPGWHIECSAMSMKYLGNYFDIHTGGIDHIPVHHNNEIAQSEASTGEKFVNYWVHNDYLLLDKGKMSKSLGGFITLDTLIDKGYSSLAFRYLCLMTHYKNKMSFSWEAMDSATNTLKNIYDLVKRGYDNLVTDNNKRDEIIQKFNDDMDVPGALAILHSENNPELWLGFDRILGLGLNEVKNTKLSEKHQKLLEERQIARKNKDWQKSDDIRKELEKEGIIIEDTKDGYRILTK